MSAATTFTSILTAICCTCSTLTFADSIVILSKYDSSGNHCLNQSTSGYVSGFDGSVFEVYTVLVACEGNDRVPAKCLPLIRPNNQGPTELQEIMEGNDYQLVRHTVPAEEVVGIRFDQTVHSVCKAGDLKIEKRTGPIMQPTSLQPVTEDEIVLLALSDAIAEKEKAFTGDWTTLVKGKKSLGKGDTVYFENVAVPKSINAKKGSNYLAGRLSTTGFLEQYVVLEGKFEQSSATGMKFEVDNVIQVQTSRDSMGKLPSPKQATNLGLKPVRVANKQSSSGTYNWQGETTSSANFRFRLLSIQSTKERVIEIESENKGTTPMHMRSVRRSQ